ncbi:hypothetical protein EBZ39_01865 [bacterium]|nr:hypothetical protein [bacterium]
MTAASDTLEQWQAVPARVAALLPKVLQVKAAHIKAALAADLLGQSYATWQPDTDTVTVYGPDIPESFQQAKYAQALARPCVFEKTAAPNFEKEILIKRAGLPWIAPTFDYAQKAMGGATPLTNALLIGLTAGGLGYGAGTLAENLFPERYLERGRLRKTLGTVGALGGLGYGAMAAHVNARANDKPFWYGWTIPNDSRPKHPIPKIKTADAWLNPQIYGNSGFAGPPIDVPKMNEAIWNDARKGFINGFQQHTPPAYAAAASGMMTGLSTGVQSPIIRPSDVINGIASAGVGLATATVAGKALSALAGLTPAAQEKIQDMGLWGGMMHAIVPAMLGLR